MNVASREDHYNEYYINRRPADFANKMISFWHRRMYCIADQSIKDLNRKSLLEVGPGFGYFSNVCRDNGLLNYTGIEMNQNLAAELTQSGFKVVCSSIPPFPSPDKKVDVIWMSHILEHARDYVHAREMLQSAYEKLSENGHIVIICPDLCSWKSNFYDLDWSHGFPTTLIRINQILSDVGFNIVFSRHHVATSTNRFNFVRQEVSHLKSPQRLGGG